VTRIATEGLRKKLRIENKPGAVGEETMRRERKREGKKDTGMSKKHNRKKTRCKWKSRGTDGLRAIGPVASREKKLGECAKGKSRGKVTDPAGLTCDRRKSRRD